MKNKKLSENQAMLLFCVIYLPGVIISLFLGFDGAVSLCLSIVIYIIVFNILEPPKFHNPFKRY